MPYRTSYIRTTSNLVCLSAASLLAVVALAMVQTKDSPIVDHTGQPTEVADYGWRKTRFGWQDSTLWYIESAIPRSCLELVHPFIWASLILILVVGAAVWAAEEWELSRCFQPKSKLSRRSACDHESEQT